MYARRPQRDPREDDPDYYKDWGGRWVKRTVWTLDNYESLRDWDTYCKFIQETTPRQRWELKDAYLRSQGLVPWKRFPETYATPERVAELEARYQEGMRRSREAQRQAERFRHMPWLWC